MGNAPSGNAPNLPQGGAGGGENRQIPGNPGQGQYTGGGYIPNSASAPQNANIPGGSLPPGAYPMQNAPGHHPHHPHHPHHATQSAAAATNQQQGMISPNNFAAGATGGETASDYRQFPPQQQQQQQQQPFFPTSGSSQIPTQQQHAASHLKKSSSDTSMTFMDGDLSSSTPLLTSQQHHKAQLAHSQSAPNTEVLESIMDDETVPTVFRWEHGGRQVYITGTFNGWSRQIPMHRSGNDFTYIHNLKRGKHAFKFIVDDEWRFAPDQPTVADIEGRINNFIDVTDFKPYRGDRDFEKEKAAADYGATAEDGVEVSGSGANTGGGGGGGGGAAGITASVGSVPGVGAPSGVGGGTTAGVGVVPGGAADVDGDLAAVMGSEKGKPDKDGEIYSNNMPDVDDYTKEPPPLPPHLRHIILNKPPQLQDTAALPVPQHVALNHLYCTAIRDNMMVLGITQRFKTKFVTTVYYSPCSNK